MDDHDLLDPALLMPLLRPTPRRGPGPRVNRRLFEDDAHSPLTLFYGRLLEDRNLYLTAGHLVELELSQEELEEICINNWQNFYQDLEWNQIDTEVKDGSRPILMLDRQDDLVSSFLLSQAHLDSMHEHFGSEVLHLGVPDDFSLLVHEEADVLDPIMEIMWNEARQNQIEYSPVVFCSVRGVIKRYTIPSFY